MDFVSLRNVYKRYGSGEVAVTAADGVSFDVGRGEFAIVTGPSGSGKTTVLNLLGGMDQADEGEILIDGKNIAAYSHRELIGHRRYDIGFVFQFYNLIPNLTAKENVELATQISHDAVSPEEMLRKVGLGERMDNFPAGLSGGEQQRVAIARALAKRPKLLLCDEPTGALDYNTGKMILELLADTCKKEKMTVILVTHNSAIAPMGDKVIRMKSSKVREVVSNSHPTPISEIEW
ncbi:MAG: ABC transporter ATP-binding protein [Candidatus Howiella sp.]|jgi:putative ABC transport system ATP-binding protein